MTEQVFPYANIIVGILIFIVGFGLHFIGQVRGIERILPSGNL